MRSRDMFKLNKKHRKLALLLALALCFSVFSISTPDSSVYAGQTGVGDEDETEGTSEEETSDETSEDGTPKSNILTPKTGRVSFWEWEKVTPDNFYDLLSDGQFHAALFGYKTWYMTGYMSGSTSSNASLNYRTQFLSTYADGDHLFYSSNTEWSKIDSNFTIRTLRDLYGVNDWNTAISSAAGSHTGEIDQFRSLYIKCDEMGVNKVPTTLPKKFFTSEDGCMGCLWIKCSGYNSSTMAPRWRVNVAESAIYQMGIAKALVAIGAVDKPSQKERNTAAGDPSYCHVQIALSRGALKDPMDTSYYSIGTGFNEKDDYFLYVRRWGGDDGEHYEPVLCARHKMINDLPDVDRFSIYAYKSDLSLDYYNKIGIRNYRSDYGWHAGDDNDNCFAYLGVQSYGYAMPLIADHGGNDWFDYLYIGTPHNFTSLTSQKIPEGKLLPISNNTFFDDDNDMANFEGGIIPKGHTIEVEGTLVVSGNLINNGTIDIKPGGTLLVKDGGCISPYLENAEGVIKNNGGTIIIMEGGSIYGTYNEGNEGYLNYCPLIMTAGGTLINYGTLAFSAAKVANGCKIENRKDGQLYCGYSCKDNTRLFYNMGTSNLLEPTSEYIKKEVYYCINASAEYGSSVSYSIFEGSDSSGAYIYGESIRDSDVEEVASISRQYDGINNAPQSVWEEFLISHGYYTGSTLKTGITGITDGEKATVVNEKSATFNHSFKSVDTAPADRVNIIVPEY